VFDGGQVCCDGEVPFLQRVRHDVKHARQVADFVAGGECQGHRCAAFGDFSRHNAKPPQRLCDAESEEVGAESACDDDESREEENIGNHRREFVLQPCVGQPYLNDTGHACRLRSG
jgi:hypothetical protein